MNFVDSEDINPGVKQEVNIKKYLFKLLRRWPKILAFFLFALLIGYAINRYSTPVYEVKARITTKKFSDKPSSPVPGLVDANFFLAGMTEVYEEIPILKSPSRIEAAVEKLDLSVRYFADGWVKNTESTNGFGFEVSIDTVTGPDYPYGVPVFVNKLSEQNFQLRIDNEVWSEGVEGRTYRFDSLFRVGDAVLQIQNTNGKIAEHDKYYFVLYRKAELVNEYSKALNINWTMPGSAMLDLRIESELPERDLKFLKAYYQVVEEMGLEEKNESLDNTIEFIDSQMETVTDSLIYYQEIIDGMKLDNQKLSLGSDYVYNKLNELDEKKAQILLNERYFDYLTNYFNTKSSEEVFAPSLIGLNIPPLEDWVNQFINEKLKDKYQRNDANFQNPLVNREDSLRRKLEKGIFESIRSARQSNQLTLNELNQQAAALYNSVKGIQTDFRELSRYERMYSLNQTLYDLFLRRKTEAAISKASAGSDYKIIEAPSYSRNPILPDEELNLIIAAALGLFLPIGFFLIKDITNSRIMDKDDLQMHTQIPVLGNVAHSSYDSSLVIKDHPRSVVAESFRAIRANLKYLSGNVAGKAHTFLITSSVSGEGKTFCSLNLACTLAISEKKTILIAADLRKPQLANYMKWSHSKKGLSEYLAGFADMSEIILPGESDLPDFIDSGNVPPNPSELLSNERMAALMTSLKQHYDFVILDTPPIGLVSDAMELFKFTDFNILIVRQQVTHKGALDMVNELYTEGKLKSFSVLFNDIELTKRGGSYGGGYLYGMGYSGYGYGYYQEDRGVTNSRKG